MAFLLCRPASLLQDHHLAWPSQLDQLFPTIGPVLDWDSSERHPLPPPALVQDVHGCRTGHPADANSSDRAGRTGLVQAEIIEAELTFNDPEIVGNPWTVHGVVFVEQLQYDKRPLRGGDFELEGFELGKFASSPPGTVDVTLPISRLLRTPPKDRFQVRVRLGQPTDHDSTDDYISFTGATLNIVYLK